jgi:hypothetical protein
MKNPVHELMKSSREGSRAINYEPSRYYEIQLGAGQSGDVNNSGFHYP